MNLSKEAKHEDYDAALTNHKDRITFLFNKLAGAAQLLDVSSSAFGSISEAVDSYDCFAASVSANAQHCIDKWLPGSLAAPASIVHHGPFVTSVLVRFFEDEEKMI